MKLSVISNYDMWKLMNPYDLEIAVSECPACNESIYKGEEVYLIDCEYVHEDCFEEFARQTLDASLQYAE
jgi:hypothetical protein